MVSLSAKHRLRHLEVGIGWDVVSDRMVTTEIQPEGTQTCKVSAS